MHEADRQARWDLIVELTRVGLSARVIATRVGCSPRQVARVRVRMGVSQVHRLTDEQIAQAGTLLADGASYREAARTVGCNAMTLAARFPGMGWEQGRGVDMRRLQTGLEAL